MMERAEGFFEGLRKTQLFYQTWTSPTFLNSPETTTESSEAQSKAATAHDKRDPASAPRSTNKSAIIVITHGHGEHSECYNQVAQDLSSWPLQIWAWDLRGHGRSQGARGAARDFYEYTQDFEIFINMVLKSEIKAAVSNMPVILFGHSMGGLVQLKALLGWKKMISSPQILSAPFFETSMAVPQWKKTMSQVLYNLAPQFTLGNEIDFGTLSSDPQQLEIYRKDPYRHDRICAGVFEAAMTSAKDVIKNASLFTGPILGFGSDPDPVVSTPRIREFFAKLPPENPHSENRSQHAHRHQPPRLTLFPNRKHEVLNDLGREDALDLINRFLQVQLD